MKKRTRLDFSQHELKITETPEIIVHYLKKPNTIIDSIKFINTNGILAVTGDYGNWIFCRSFVPSATGEGVSDGYWCQKLRIASTQKDSNFDKGATDIEIKERLKELKENKDHYDDIKYEELKDYYESLIELESGEGRYMIEAYDNLPFNFDSDDIPCVYQIDYSLLVIFDAFEEICKRLKNKE